MDLRSKIILFLLLFLVSCGPNVYLDPMSNRSYKNCDRLCKEKYGEDVSVYGVGKNGDCYCK